MNDNIYILQREIKICEKIKNLLLNNKPYWFQKTKLKEYNEKLNYIDQKIESCLIDIEKELSIINVKL